MSEPDRIAAIREAVDEGWTIGLSESKLLLDRLAVLERERDEARAIIKATGHEIDAMRSQASAADARRLAAEHRAQRIVLDAELKSRAEAAEAALRALQQQIRELLQQWKQEIANAPSSPSYRDGKGECVRDLAALLPSLAPQPQEKV